MVDKIGELATRSGNVKVFFSGPWGTTSIVTEIGMIAYTKK
jgi:hypothetical protein